MNVICMYLVDMYFVSVYTHMSMRNNISACVLYMYLYSLLFSCSVMSNSLWPHCLQHARLPCPSLSPGACSNSCPSVGDAVQPSQPLSSSPPALNLSKHHGLFQCVGSSHQVAKVLEFQLQHQSFQWIFKGWFPLALTGLISLLSKGHSRAFSNTTIQKHQFFSAQPSSMVQLSYPYMTIGKAIALTIWNFVSKVMSLLCNTLSRFVIAFLVRSNMYLYKHMLYTLHTYVIPMMSAEDYILGDSESGELRMNEQLKNGESS